MTDATQNPSASAPKLPVRLGSLLFLQLLPLFALAAAVAVLVFVYTRYQKFEGVSRANDVAQFELKRMTGVFNHRLNEVREQLSHLYGEQTNLARALNEAERERLVFFRRDYLGAYGVLTMGSDSKWTVQKYYLRSGVSRDEKNIETILNLFREADSKQAFWLKQVDPALFGVNWNGAAAFVLGYFAKDDAGKTFAYLGVFPSTYLFPFCHFFNDSLGKMTVDSFVLAGDAQVLCHSKQNYERTNFKSFALWNSILDSAKSDGYTRYENPLGTKVAAAAKKIEPGDIFFVSEAAEVSPWTSTVPYKTLGLSAAVLLILVSATVSFVGVKILGTHAPVAQVPQVSQKAPIVEPLLQLEPTHEIQLGEFRKLKHEIAELEAALLESQSAQAFVSGFQTRIANSAVGNDLSRILFDYFEDWNTLRIWFEPGENVTFRSKFIFYPAQNEPVAQIDVKDEDVTKSVRAKLNLSEQDQLVVIPAKRNEKVSGLLVLGGLSPAQAEWAASVVQWYAFVKEA